MFSMQWLMTVIIRGNRNTFALLFHVFHFAGSAFQVFLSIRRLLTNEHRSNQERNCGSCSNRTQYTEDRIFWRHQQHSEDRTWRCRRYQTSAEYSQSEHTSHTTSDNSQDQTWVHQHVWEVDFVNTTQEVNDRRTSS